MKTLIYLREENEYKEVRITSKDKPVINEVITEKWQHIINLVACLMEAPSGLIMRITEDSMKVFVKNQSIENPYEINGEDSLKKGLYCETVIGRDQELHIENSLKHHDWENSPDVKLNMISYYGLPIKWPDGEFFGTICVLDNKSMNLKAEHKEILRELRNSLEKDLALALREQELKRLAQLDALTGVYNRRMMDEIISNEINQSLRSNTEFSLVLIDMNRFKEINDTLGHEMGDLVLRKFSKIVMSRIRKTDFFGRWGGDEFILVCTSTDVDGVKRLLADIIDACKEGFVSIFNQFSFSYGVATFLNDANDYDGLLSRADRKMYEMKNKS